MQTSSLTSISPAGPAARPGFVSVAPASAAVSSPADRCTLSGAPQPTLSTTPAPGGLRQYLVDKAKDVATAAVLTLVNPLSLPQNLLGLVISLGSTGHRISGSLGFAIYENARGLSNVVGRVLGQPPAYDMGFAAFAPGAVDRDTLVHEQQHYFQSLVTGPLFLPGIAFEAIRAARQCGANSECVHRVSVFEVDAALAERVGPHFPFVDPGDAKI